MDYQKCYPKMDKKLKSLSLKKIKLAKRSRERELALSELCLPIENIKKLNNQIGRKTTKRK